MTFSVVYGGAVLYALESGDCNRVHHSTHDDDELAAYLSKLPCLLKMCVPDPFAECLLITSLVKLLKLLAHFCMHVRRIKYGLNFLAFSSFIN